MDTPVLISVSPTSFAEAVGARPSQTLDSGHLMCCQFTRTAPKLVSDVVREHGGRRDLDEGWRDHVRGVPAHQGA